MKFFLFDLKVTARKLTLVNFIFYQAILAARKWMSAMRESETLVVKNYQRLVIINIGYWIKSKICEVQIFLYEFE